MWFVFWACVAVWGGRKVQNTRNSLYWSVLFAARLHTNHASDSLYSFCGLISRVETCSQGARTVIHDAFTMCQYPHEQKHLYPLSTPVFAFSLIFSPFFLPISTSSFQRSFICTYSDVHPTPDTWDRDISPNTCKQHFPSLTAHELDIGSSRK